MIGAVGMRLQVLWFAKDGEVSSHTSLGCGIGVLLRMLWVMVLVTARAFRGSRDEDEAYDVVFDEAEMLVPPPQYTIIQGSEAVPVAVDEKKEPVA